MEWSEGDRVLGVRQELFEHTREGDHNLRYVMGIYKPGVRRT